MVEALDAIAETNESPWIDDMFKVEESRWKVWCSYDKSENKLVSSLTEDACIAATRFYLKGLQDGFSPEDKTHSGTVEGKL